MQQLVGEAADAVLAALAARGGRRLSPIGESAAEEGIESIGKSAAAKATTQ
jgi:hypothetical protein